MYRLRDIKLRNYRRDNNLCVKCGNKLDKPDKFCTICRNKTKELQIARREKLLSDGLCPICGRNPIENLKRCNVCHEKIKIKERNRRIKLREQSVCRRCRAKLDRDFVVCSVCAAKRKLFDQKIKDEVYSYYGGYKCNCPGCLITETYFLTIDHIENNGTQHRKAIKYVSIVKWLKNNNFPSGYQVLCMNCQFGKKHNNGVCPCEGKPHF